MGAAMEYPSPSQGSDYNTRDITSLNSVPSFPPLRYPSSTLLSRRDQQGPKPRPLLICITPPGDIEKDT